MSARDNQHIANAVEYMQGLFDSNNEKFERKLVLIRAERQKYLKKKKKTTK